MKSKSTVKNVGSDTEVQIIPGAPLSPVMPIGERDRYIHGMVSDNILHVIRVVSNPCGYARRYNLANQQDEHLKGMRNIILYTVECQFGDRCFQLTDSDNKTHLQLRTNSEIWTKENMINLAVEKLLPKDWKYMAWIDADITFRDNSWAAKTIEELQHFAIVQPWSDMLDLGVAGNVLHHFRSFGYQCQHVLDIGLYNGKPNFGHPGLAWACTRKFYDKVGKLLDCGILGSGDHHMAWSCISKFDNFGSSAGYINYCMEWQNLAHVACGCQVGYIPGRIEHNFHGGRRNRFYLKRMDILLKWCFDPTTDIDYDSQGLMILNGKPGLEMDIRRYNRSRNEDTIDEDGEETY